MLMNLEVMVFSPVGKTGMILSCENTVASMMPIGSPVSVLTQPSEGSSATPRLASSVWNGGKKTLCGACGKVKRETLDFLSDNPFYTKRFSYYIGR